MGNLYNQFDHKCPFCGKYHEQPHYKRSRHDRPQRRDCPFINQEHSKQNRSRGNPPVKKEKNNQKQFKGLDEEAQQVPLGQPDLLAD